VPRKGEGWAVERAGADRASSLHDKKQDAVDAARHTAQREGLELVVHRENGTIGEKDSHGRDKFPPRG